MTTKSNSSLNKAAKVKNDEFYTQLADIEKELKRYKDQFRGKVLYCNCDDPFEYNAPQKQDSGIRVSFQA